jgi:hypothetical protein
MAQSAAHGTRDYWPDPQQNKSQQITLPCCDMTTQCFPDGNGRQLLFNAFTHAHLGLARRRRKFAQTDWM